MKKILLLLLLLVPVFVMAQFPDTPRKLRLGTQTDANYLIYVQSGAPAHTPADGNDTYMVLDTSNHVLYYYDVPNSEWDTLTAAASTTRDTVYQLTAVPDTITTSPLQGDIFVNATADTLGVYNGAAWVLFFGGSGGAISAATFTDTDTLTITEAGTDTKVNVPRIIPAVNRAAVLSLSPKTGARIKLEDNGAEYVVQADTVAGYATDSVAVIPTAAGTYAVLKGNALDLEAFGVTYGAGQSEAVWKANRRAFVRACQWGAKIGAEIIVSGVAELWSGPGYVNEFAAGEGFRLKGLSKHNSILDFQPKTDTYFGGVSKVINFNAEDDSDFLMETLAVYGDSLSSYFQTYDVYLQYNGNNDQIKIRDTAAVWSGLWSNLSAGDTILYDRDYDDFNNLTGFFGVVASVDSTTRVITLTAPLNAATSSADSLSTTHIGIAWPRDGSASIDTVLAYSETWVYEFSGFNESFFIWVEGTQNSGRGRVLEIKNCDLRGFVETIYGTSNLPLFRATDSYFQGTGVAITWFPNTAPEGEYVSMVLDNVEITNCGTAITGGTDDNAQAGGIYGSGLYTHPNNPWRIVNSHIHNNIAAAARQFSSAGASSKPSNPYHLSVIENTVFESNAEYHLLTSGVMPTELRNVTFIDGDGVQLSFTTTAINCTFDNTSVVLSSNNDPASTAAEQFRITFRDCFWDAGSYFGQIGWDTGELQRTNISFIGNTFIVTDAVNSKISVHTATGVTDSLYVEILDCKYKVDESLTPSVLPSTNNGSIQAFIDAFFEYEAEVYIKNLQPLSKRGFYGTSSFMGERATTGGKITIEDSDLTAWGWLSTAVRANFRNQVTLNGVQAYGGYLFRNEFQYNSLPDGIEYVDIGSYSTSSVLAGAYINGTSWTNVAVLPRGADKFTLGGNTLENIFLQWFYAFGSNNATVHGQFSGRVTIYPQDTITVLPFSNTNQDANIVAEDTLTLLPGEQYEFQSYGYHPLGLADSTQVFLDTIGTGDAVTVAFSNTINRPLRTMSDATPICYIPGTMFLKTSDGISCPINVDGTVECDSLSGTVSTLRDAYIITFNTAPTSGAAIYIEGLAVRNPRQLGYWKQVGGNVVAGTDDQTAAEVSITDAGAYYTGTDVEAALGEIADTLAQHRTDIDAISFTDTNLYTTSGTITAGEARTVTISGDTTSLTFQLTVPATNQEAKGIVVEQTGAVQEFHESVPFKYKEGADSLQWVINDDQVYLENTFLDLQIISEGQINIGGANASVLNGVGNTRNVTVSVWQAPDSTATEEGFGAGEYFPLSNANGTFSRWFPRDSISTLGGDNLGNHTATTTLDMANNNIDIGSGYISPDGTNTGIQFVSSAPYFNTTSFRVAQFTNDNGSGQDAIMYIVADDDRATIEMQANGGANAGDRLIFALRTDQQDVLYSVSDASESTFNEAWKYNYNTNLFTIPSGNLQVNNDIVMGAGGPLITSGSGSPESVVTAPVGSMYLRTDGGAGTTLYVKESGTGNTGWIAK